MNQYLDLLKKVRQEGKEKGDRTGTGTISVFGYQMRYDLSQNFPLLTTKKVHFKSMAYELLWFLKGDTNVKYLQDNKVKIWDEWADDEGNLGRIYGAQWTDWKKTDGGSLNQIDEVKKGKVVSNWDLNAFAPAGGVLSTVEDLAQFAQAHFGNDIALEMQMKKTAQYSEKVDIGLGWLIFYDSEGNPIYWHNGGTGGYSSDMTVSVENQKSVVILSNVSAFVKETREYRNLNFTLLSLIE